MRVVVIGGLGNFGARICHRLAQEPGIEVIATSRRPTCQGGFVNTAALDTSAPSFGKDLKALGPDLVIHCAGPFQGQDYRVALASMGCHAHYIDIADGREFVTGFVGAVGSAAEAAGRFAITGASTLPARSSAVVDDLKQSLAQLSAIDIVIAPGQHAPRGAATVAGVLGYAGQPFLWWREGKWRNAYGWQEPQRAQLSFGSRWAAACDGTRFGIAAGAISRSSDGQLPRRSRSILATLCVVALRSMPASGVEPSYSSLGSAFRSCRYLAQLAG